MVRLLRFLDEPQEKLRIIHIAGTKGKGSTCAFGAHILNQAGFKVGLYTSPHLVDVRERIRLLKIAKEDKISQKDFARLIGKIKPYAEKLRETKLGNLSYYEILTALGFLYFKEKKVDFAVLETGIGGRLDATNTAPSLVSAFSPISYEHTQVLGKTLTKIAEEKAAIIKQKSKIVVTAPQRPAVLKVIRRRAKKVGARLYEVGKDIQVRERSASLSGQSFDVKGVSCEYRGLNLKLLGKHQVINAAVAVGCIESLRRFGVKISQQAIRSGLRKTVWPGRLQMISQRPRIVLDAAHNQASACALKEALNRFFKFRSLTLVFGVSQDKDARGILRELAPQAARIILTRAKSPRAMPPAAIRSFIKTNERPIIITRKPARALEIARQSAGPQDLILICGSLYLLGEILKSEPTREQFSD